MPGKDKVDETTTRGQTHAEAPGSATVKVTVNGYGWLYTIRNDDPAELLENLQHVTNAMITLGYLPDKGGAAAGGGGQRRPYAAPDPNAPICPSHHKPMLLSKSGNNYFCSGKLADDDGTGKPVYCKYTVRKEDVGL